MSEIEKLKKQLAKVEKNLDKCRTSALMDGFGTMRHARKSRKWDYYARQKFILKCLIEILKMKNNRGGKRNGAGAKPFYGEKTKAVSFKVPLSKIEEFKIYVKLKLKSWLT